MNSPKINHSDFLGAFKGQEAADVPNSVTLDSPINGNLQRWAFVLGPIVLINSGADEHPLARNLQELNRSPGWLPSENIVPDARLAGPLGGYHWS